MPHGLLTRIHRLTAPWRFTRTMTCVACSGTMFAVPKRNMDGMTRFMVRSFRARMGRQRQYILVRCSKCRFEYMAHPEVELTWVRKWSRRNERELQQASQALHESTTAAAAAMNESLREQGVNDAAERSRLIEGLFHPKP